MDVRVVEMIVMELNHFIHQVDPICRSQHKYHYNHYSKKQQIANDSNTIKPELTQSLQSIIQ